MADPRIQVTSTDLSDPNPDLSVDSALNRPECRSYQRGSTLTKSFASHRAANTAGLFFDYIHPDCHSSDNLFLTVPLHNVEINNISRSGFGRR